MLSRRRAVSEIVGSLIVLLIVSTMGTYLYNHALTIISYEQTSLDQQMTITSNKAQERLKVIATWWSPAYDVLNTTVYNYGSKETKIADVYVNGERVTDFISGRLDTIGVYELGKICFRPPTAIIPESLTEITIVSQRGVSHVYNSEA